MNAHDPKMMRRPEPTDWVTNRHRATGDVRSRVTRHGLAHSAFRRAQGLAAYELAGCCGECRCGVGSARLNVQKLAGETMNTRERARAALSVRSLTPAQIEDCLPSVTATLGAVERETRRETAEQCAKIADANYNTLHVDGDRIYRNGWRHSAEDIGTKILAAFPQPKPDNHVNPKQGSAGAVGTGQEPLSPIQQAYNDLSDAMVSQIKILNDLRRQLAQWERGQPNTDPAWLEAQSAAEDGCFVSAGGLVTDLETMDRARVYKTALARCVQDIEQWADGESVHVLQDALDAARAALASTEDADAATGTADDRIPAATVEAVRRHLEGGECECRKALEILVKRLDVIHADPRYQSVWQMFMIHGGDYTNGPKYDKELEGARAALSSPCSQARVAELEAKIADLEAGNVKGAALESDLMAACAHLRAERASLRSKLVEMEAERLTLRRRIHLAEGHNQFFERCESAWCNPTPNANPAAGQIGAAWETPAQFQARINELEAEMERRNRDRADSLASFHHALASRDSFLSQLLEARAQLAKSTEHRGNFLWPYDKETEPIKCHGYEVINGRNDEYIQIHWDALIEAVEAPLRSQLADCHQLLNRTAPYLCEVDTRDFRLDDHQNLQHLKAEIDAARSKDSTDGK